MPSPGNHVVGSVAPGGPTRAQNGIIFSPASSSPLCSRTVPWSRNLFSPTNIPQQDGAVSFITEKGLDIRASAPTVAPLVKCQCSQSTPLLHPTQTWTPTQPVSNKPVPSSPLPQTPVIQIQPNQILAPLQPVTLPTISTLPEEDESEPEPDHLDPEQEQQEPEPDK